MKKRAFLFISLLLICVLIPLLEVDAVITVQLLEGTSQNITTEDTGDVVLTVRYTAEAGDTASIYSETAGPTVAISNQITTEPQTLNIASAGDHDITITIPRSIFTTLGTKDFQYVGADLLLSNVYTIAFTVTLRLPEDAIVEIDLEVIGSAIRSYTTAELQNITYNLRVTNKSEVPSLTILIEAPANAFGVNVDTNLATLSPTTLTLAPNESEDVTLTIPKEVISEVGNWFVNVIATPSVGAKKSVFLVINILTVSGVILEVLEDETQTTDISDTEDIFYVLRLSNAGSDRDRIELSLLGDLDLNSAELDTTETVLDPDGFQDITLTIPRSSLQEPGMYDVIVRAVSQNNPSISDGARTETVVTGEAVVKTDVTPKTPTPDETSLTAKTPITEETETTDKTYELVLSEFMFESEGGVDSLPQWIEIYNNSESEINVKGWKLQWNQLKPSLSDVTITIQEDFIIPSQQCRLIVSSFGRYSGGGHLSNDAVFLLTSLQAVTLVSNGQKDVTDVPENAQVDKEDIPDDSEIIAADPEDIENRNRVITEAFSLKLLNKRGILVDEIGTLVADKQAWELHESLIDGVRSSLIRRFDDKVPRNGKKRSGWRRAYDAKRLVAGIYYGKFTDLGTPGYRRGKPLPVQLSHFSPRFVKDAVVINWITESELNNAGFNILRSTSPTKNFRKINTKLIKGAGTTGKRNQYKFIDKTAKPNIVYYYRLEEISLSGQRAILLTYQLRGVISPTGKHITKWGELKHLE